MNAIERLMRRNLSGEAVGITSYCTAHEETLRAVCEASATADGAVLVEATCNQVNQDGGYTGLRPVEFRRLIEGIAADAGLPPHRLWLGGDHLGPNPWRTLPAADAMDRAAALVAAYAAAGFSKLHLDASMRLGGDPLHLDEAVVAERAARLCAVAEAAAESASPVYVIGTEVPVPGGETDGFTEIRPTAPAALADTLDHHRRAFAKLGLSATFARVIAVVAQPGVDFSNDAVMPFDPAGAIPLGEAVAAIGQVVCEAHSTDYQPATTLTRLIQSHFAILKVGPELTAAYRRAMLGLAHVEDEVIPKGQRSGLLEALLRAMNIRPADWAAYYPADGIARRLTQLYSYSDRIRYYWSDPAVAKACLLLLANLDSTTIPPLLFQQYLPDLQLPYAGQSTAVVAREAVGQVVRRYQRATGAGP